MKKLKYISVQPRLLYFAWQVEVMINNFISNGINPNDIQILVAYNDSDKTSDLSNIECWDKLVNHFKDVNFYFYKDTRVKPIRYISSIRPNILKQHFKNHPELSNDAIFYHDCDICFTKPIDYSNLLQDDVWYLSDTNGYINYDYISSKKHGVYEKMCEIVGIHESIPIKFNKDSGGAQYILKNIDWTYWKKVETDCENLFYGITNLNNEIKITNPYHHELQIWCADMWSVLWNGWMRGNITKIVPDMAFSFATDTIDLWDSKPIFHNAGVTGGPFIFFKSDYMEKLPYHSNFENFKDTFCGYNYTKEILKTKKISCLI